MTVPTLYAWFADTVRRHPDATALEVDGSVFSYADLHELVERTAGALVRAHGAVPGAVAPLAARGLAAYVGYLAGLRLGAVVVPLNPAYPVPRNLAIAAAAEVTIVVADDSAGTQSRAFAAQSSAATGRLVTVMELAGDWPDRLAPVIAGELPEPALTGDGVAYLLFTSGSTGAPKGVPILHANVSAYLRHIIDSYGLEPGNRWPNTAELTFDISVGELFGAWGSGGTLVAPRAQADLLNPVRYVNECDLTHWFSVPSVISLAARLRLLRPGCMPALRCSMFAGEQLAQAQAQAWAAAAPNTTIDNLYGPTETTITCGGYRLPRDRGQWPVTSNGTLPIGGVYPGTEWLVLDAEGRQSDDGELLLRGRQRFPGYLDPARNAGSFVLFDGRMADGGPGEITSEHWYRTGDRVRIENGLLVHVGRLDHQVKLRGYRVELGEIEAVLRRHPGVEQAVVVPDTDDGGDPCLIAYYTGPVADAELPGIMAASLPAYMCPRLFRQISRIPLSINGKVDRVELARRYGGGNELIQAGGG